MSNGAARNGRDTTTATTTGIQQPPAATGTEAGAGGNDRQRPGATRRAVSMCLFVIGLVLAPISVVTTWAATTVTDTDRYVATVAPLASNPSIQQAVSTDLTRRIVRALDIPAIVSAALPARAAALHGVVTNTVQSFVGKVVSRVVASPAFARVFTAANRLAHSTFVAVVEGNRHLRAGGGARRGEVDLDLSRIVPAIRQQLAAAGLPVSHRLTGSKLHASVTIFTSPQVHHIGELIRLLDKLGVWLAVATLAILVIAVLLAADRRRRTALAGLWVAFGMAVLLVGLLVVRAYYLSRVPASILPRDAAAATFDILVTFLRQAAWGVLALALVVAAVASLAGPSTRARALRREWTRVLGGFGDNLEQHGVLPAGLRNAMTRVKVPCQIVVVALAIVALVLWRSRTAVGVVLTVLLTLLVTALIETMARRKVPADEQQEGAGTAGHDERSGEQHPDAVRPGAA
jgi:hypothetical protein